MDKKLQGSQLFIKDPNLFNQHKWSNDFLNFLGTPKTLFMVIFGTLLFCK